MRATHTLIGGPNESVCSCMVGEEEAGNNMMRKNYVEIKSWVANLVSVNELRTVMFGSCNWFSRREWERAEYEPSSGSQEVGEDGIQRARTKAPLSDLDGKPALFLSHSCPFCLQLA